MNLKQNFFQEATSYEQLAKKPYKCWHCNKSYFLKHHLKRHTTFECGKLPQLQCPSCPRRFTYKSSLKRHKITHLPQVRIVQLNILINMTRWLFIFSFIFTKYENILKSFIITVQSGNFFLSLKKILY